MNQHMRMMLVVGFLVAIAPAPFDGSAALALDAKAIGGGPSGGPVAVTPPAPTGGGTPSATPAPTPGSGVTPQQNPTTSTTSPTT